MSAAGRFVVAKPIFRVNYTDKSRAMPNLFEHRQTINSQDFV